MIKLFKTLSVLAVVVAVLGAFSIYGNGHIVDPAFAEGHDVVDTYDPPTEDSYVEASTESYECTDCDYVEVSTEYYECTDCDYVEASTESYECTDCDYVDASTDFYECTDCDYVETSTDYYDCANCIFDYSDFQGAYLFEGEYNVQSDKFDDPAFYEGTFIFDADGAFVFDGGPYLDGEEEYFPDGEFYEFFDPGDFSHDEFYNTFNPDAFAGDFGDFFQGGDFQSGEFEQFFDPGYYNPEEFGTYFDFEEFIPGDFGTYAAIGGEYIDFGGYFDQFFGEQSEEALAAAQFFGELTVGDYGFIPSEELLGQLDALDYQGFQSLDADFVYDLFQNGLAGQEFDLQGEQWAGAFSQFNVDEIHNFDQDFLGGAVHDFAPEDFIGIPDDQAFALFESTFFGGYFDGGPPPDFDPSAFEEKLDEFGAQLSGFLGAFGQEHYQQLEDGQLVDIFTRIDFTAEDFDSNVLGGDNLGGIFGALDYESFAGLDDEQILDAIGIMEAKDFGAWDPAAAYNVFDNIAFGQVVEFEYLDALVGAMGLEQFEDLDDEKLVDLITTFAFGGPDFDLTASALDGADIAGLIGSLDGDHLGELGGDGILEAIQHLEDKDLTAWAGATAFDVFSTIGFDQALDLDQLEGIVGNFAADHIEQLGDQLNDLLGALDFQNNADILGEFSFGALSILDSEDLQGLGVQYIIDLTNATGGDEIIGLGAEQLEIIVGNIQADFFAEFDPSVVGGIFAGLDHDQIGGFDFEILEAALEATGANLLGGLGDFDSIAGVNTAFDELANLAGFGEGLEQDGSFVIEDEALNFFSGNLFGFN